MCIGMARWATAFDACMCECVRMCWHAALPKFVCILTWLTACMYGCVFVCVVFACVSVGVCVHECGLLCVCHSGYACGYVCTHVCVGHAWIRVYVRACACTKNNAWVNVVAALVLVCVDVSMCVHGGGGQCACAVPYPVWMCVLMGGVSINHVPPCVWLPAC